MVAKRRVYTPYERSMLVTALREHYQRIEEHKAHMRALGITQIRSFTRICPEKHVHVELQFIPTEVPPIEFRLQLPFSVN